MDDLSRDQLELLARLREAAVVADGDGAIVYANPSAEALGDYEPGTLAGRQITDLLPTELRDAQGGRSAEIPLTGVPLQLSLRRADGSVRPVDVVGNPLAAEDGSGSIVWFVRASGEDAGAGQMSDVVVELVSVLSQDLPPDEANTRLLRAIVERLEWDIANLWIPEEDAQDSLRFAGTWHAPTLDVDAFVAACRAARFTRGFGLPGEVWETGVPNTIADLDQDASFTRSEPASTAHLRSAYAFPVESAGRIIGVIELLRQEVGEPPPALLPVLAAIGRRVGPYLDRVGENERRLRGEARLRLINEANQLLARWLDYRTTLDEVASMLVPNICDGCVVHVLDDGQLVRMGRAFSDPERERAAAALEAHLPVELIEEGVRRVLDSGEAVAYSEASDEQLRAVAPDERALELLRALRSRWTVIVPLVGRREMLGTLTLSRFESDRRFNRDDIAFAEELGRHLGLAVANARLYEREHAVASALQQSLLPPELPHVGGYELAARFLPGGEGLAVGGDFYDVFEVGDGRWAVVVGDVCGTGAEAAAVTSQVRYTARSIMPFVKDPAEVLQTINDSLLPRGDFRFCTAVVATLEQEGAGNRMTMACAGHPYPIIVSSDSVDAVECQGTLLGVFEDAAYENMEVELLPGQSLVLYTDGIIEARDENGALLQEAGLERALLAQVGSGASQLADTAVRAAVEHAGGPVDDDIALLVIHRA